MARIIDVTTNIPKVVKELEDAVNRAYGEHIRKTQEEAVAANPKDTGRMASSWKAQEGAYTHDAKPESWNKGGGVRSGGSAQVQPDLVNPSTPKISETWFLTNSVPYADRLAYDPKYSHGGQGGSAWWTSITNQNMNKLDERLQRAWNRVP